MGVVIQTYELDFFKNDYTLLSDFIDFFLEAEIGRGEYRTVYQFRLNDNWVIKIDRRSGGNGRFANVDEWNAYMEAKAKKSPILKYLAPCHHISSCGKILIQEKTQPIEEKMIHKLPKILPGFFTDIAVGNWGTIKGKLVCHDYANNNSCSSHYQKGRKVKWV